MFTASRPHPATVSSKSRAIPTVKALSEDACPYTLLGLSRDATRAEIRAAYIKKMKDVHPDVNQSDTTQSAVQIIEAYEWLQSHVTSPSDPADWNSKDVFDEPGRSEILFVDPFRCFNVDPLEWRALQAAAKSEIDPERGLMKNNVSFSEGAIVYLTSAQMDAVERELDRMDHTLDFEFCSWILEDALLRARKSNV